MWQTIKISLINKWGWWILARSHGTLKRMCVSDPAFAHLFKRQIEDWQDRTPMPDELKRAADKFYDTMQESISQADKRISASKLKIWR